MKFPARGQAFNQTRGAYLATALAVADTHWTRFRGLLSLPSHDFRKGDGLWIVPCHGVHTLGMGFAIDVLYLDQALTVIHMEPELRPWRIAPVRRNSLSVLELPCSTLTQTHTAVGDKIVITLAKDSNRASA
ncbi:MAG TPA: DUF192 domain-containing protein [Candidatus Binatia bacterium]|nr:DUF192 domain-containing protein [Candidatus Binatia bacterium]